MLLNKKIFEEVRYLISKSRTKEALALFFENKDKIEKESLFYLNMISSQYEQWYKDGWTPERYDRVWLNRINASILEITDTIEEDYERRNGEMEVINFNVSDLNSIRLKFKMNSWERTDEITVPKSISMQELVSALEEHYSLIKKTLERNDVKFEVPNRYSPKYSIEWEIYVNNILFQEDLEKPVELFGLKDGDLIFLKGEIHVDLSFRFRPDRFGDPLEDHDDI